MSRLLLARVRSTTKEQYFVAYRALTAKIEEHALDPDALLRDCDRAMYRHMRHWEHRAELAERSLRRVLDLEISDDVRTYVTAAVAGKSQRLTRTCAWSNAEVKMIEEYRRLSDADRSMLRRLFDRLAASTEDVKD